MAERQHSRHSKEIAVLTVIVDFERLILCENLVLANVAKFSGAVAIGGFHTDDEIVESPFVHLLDVGGLQEGGRILVHVHDRDVNRGTGKSETYFTIMIRIMFLFKNLIKLSAAIRTAAISAILLRRNQ